MDFFLPAEWGTRALNRLAAGGRLRCGLRNLGQHLPGGTYRNRNIRYPNADFRGLLADRIGIVLKESIRIFFDMGSDHKTSNLRCELLSS